MRILFALVFLFLLYVKTISLLLAALAVLVVLDGKGAKRRLKRVLFSIFLFNFGVSLGYLIFAAIKGIAPWEYLCYINLKVFVLTYCVFFFFEKVSVVQFFAFSKELGFLLTMTLAQIYSYKRTFEDFRQAFRSRVVSLRDKEYRFIATTFDFFFKKALSDAKEKSLAMRARGFFDG